MMWLWFLLGQVVNVFRQASLVARSAPEKNPIRSTWRWVYRNLIGLTVREVFAIAGWLVLTHPAAGQGLITYWFPTYAKFPTLMIDLPFLAAPFGIVFSIGSDYLMERFDWLKRHIPPLGE